MTLCDSSRMKRLIVCGCRFTRAHYPGSNRIGGVMVSVLTSSAVDRGFEPRSGQTKDYIKLVFIASPLSTHH